MPSIKITYFGLPGRAEPTYLALTVGGIPFEKNVVDHAAWGAMKPTVAPMQLPLMEVDGKLVSQSIAHLRYAGKLAKYNGKPLYPEDAFAALRVDEFGDMMADVWVPLGKTFAIADQKEKEAARAALFKPGGDCEKWLAHMDGIVGKNGTGWVVGDNMTIADLSLFCFAAMFSNGFMDGIPKDSLEHLKHIMAHRAKMAAVPAIKEYYKDETNPLFAPLKAH